MPFLTQGALLYTLFLQLPVVQGQPSGRLRKNISYLYHFSGKFVHLQLLTIHRKRVLLGARLSNWSVIRSVVVDDLELRSTASMLFQAKICSVVRYNPPTGRLDFLIRFFDKQRTNSFLSV